MISRRVVLGSALLPVTFFVSSSQPGGPAAGPRFAISFPAERSATALDGRVLLMISSEPGAEPRFQIGDRANTQLLFGVDVEGHFRAPRDG